jgi:peptidoglycan/LPS O-acetylase OafA/YrhL
MNLRRITTHGNWIPEIDGLRFVAIVATILTHILGETSARSGYALPTPTQADVLEIMVHGGRGVQVFFAISGFILAQPFLRQHLLHGKSVSLKGFFKRRVTRLEPPYVLSLLIYAVAWMVKGGFPSSILQSLLTHIVYVLNFTHLTSLNFVTWSLEVEVQFYIVAPLIGCLYAIRWTGFRRSLMVTLIACSGLISFAMSHSKVAWNLPGQLQFFLVGFLVADLRAGRPDSASSRWWDVASPLIWIALFASPQKESTFLLPALIFIAVLATFYGPTTRSIFRTRWIALTGGMCYSFYLMHMLVISVVFKFTRHLVVPSNLVLSCLVQIVVLGPFIYLCCTAFYVLIEKPCMDPSWPSKLLAKLPKQRQAPGLVSK